MFGRIPATSQARRMSLAILGGVGSLAVIAAIAISLLSGTAEVAHGNGTGSGGGGCFTNGATPVCTWKGLSSFAEFDSIDSTGCIINTAVVEQFATVYSPGRANTLFVIVALGTFDRCKQTTISTVSNFNQGTGLQDFTGTAQVGSRLMSASVNGSAQMYDDATGTPVFTSTVNVTWSGYGAATISIESNHYRDAGLVVNERFNGSTMSATASGVISDASGANAAVGTTLAASLSNASSGTVQLSHS